MKNTVSIFDRVEQIRVESSQAIIRLSTLKAGLRLSLKLELARALESIEQIFSHWEHLFEEVYQQNIKKSEEIAKISQQLEAAEKTCFSTSNFEVDSITRPTLERKNRKPKPHTGDTIRLRERARHQTNLLDTSSFYELLEEFNRKQSHQVRISIEKQDGQWMSEFDSSQGSLLDLEQT